MNPRYFKKPRINMMWVSLAGPLSNIALAVVTAFVYKQFGGLHLQTIFYPLVIMAQYMIMINVGLAVFNLIPIHPLQPYGFMILLVLIFTRAVNVVIFPIISVILNILMK